MKRVDRWRRKILKEIIGKGKISGSGKNLVQVKLPVIYKDNPT